MTTTEALFTPTVATPAASTLHGHPRPLEDDGFSFKDILDIINPLQHLPIVSTVYRRLTGDALGPAARLVGGTIYGGPLGGMIAFVNVLVEAESGRDIGENVATALLGENGDKPATTVAQADVFTVGRGESLSPQPDWPAGGIEPAPVTRTPSETLASPAGCWTPELDPGTIGTAPATEPRQPAGVGAAAADGEWFSAVMASALQKYQALAAEAAVPGVAQTI